MNDTEKRNLVKQAVDVPRLTMPDLAELTGCSTSSLRAYRTGYRMPGEESAQTMVRGLRSQATALLAIAHQLEGLYGEAKS